MLRLVLQCVFCLAVFFLAFSDTEALAEVVYENTDINTSGIYAPDGFLPFNFYLPYEEMGDQISLVGTAREVTEFDLICSSTEETTLTDLTLIFYAMDGDGGIPGTEIWSETLYDVTVDGITTVVFSVPNVVVPDTFVFATSADSDTAGMATYDPPQTGSSDDYFWDLDPNPAYGWGALWFEGDPVANFGARVIAVPEPTTALFLVVGGLLTTWRKRR